MANPQLHPLEVNPKTGEPFLRLLAHKNIILTPLRLSDGPFLVSILNDEHVYPWLISPPYPYLPEHAEWWLNQVIPETDKLLAELEDARNDPTLKIVNGCPARVIREVKEDGTDIFLGEINLGLSHHWWELEGSGKASQETPRRDPNDPDIWMVGDYLASSHYGQGIMSDAFNTLLRQWGIPRMGVRRMVVSTLEGNKGSVRVFEKLGFKFRKTIDDTIEARGTMRGCACPGMDVGR
ncbi:N-acetyltransferase domain-containing protein [Mycena venus]|uniref:N-acetyltransferase domain-containing protein n=1 Tax=Mycena venus TaxID=2733690 RepID=A0A8H6XVJ4_9AGAR|nr:N-acetyltransferase domain-containing protein [Mycena venus]